MRAPRRLKVNSPRNSDCAWPLHELGWSSWFTGGRSSGLYLWVNHKNGDTVHRVWCKHTETPLLRLKDGVLYWLVGR